MPGTFINGGMTVASCVVNDRDDGWYRFTASTTQTEITATCTGQSIAMSVYQGTVCSVPNASELQCLNIAAGGGGTISLTTVVGQQYLIQLHRTSGGPTAGVTGTICVRAVSPPPSNDECAAAAPVPVQPNFSTCTGNVVLANLAFATASANANACAGVADDDVWFSFVATSTAIGVGISEGGGLDSYHSIYSGTCGSLNLIACSDPNVSSNYGLTVGETYYVRVHTTSGVAPANPAFVGICVAEIPVPVTNMECATAIALTPSSDGQCLTNTYSTYNGLVGPTIPSCGSGDPDDDVWFSFVAQQDTHHVEVNNSTMFVEVYSGSCGSLVLESCENEFLTGLTVGATYLVRVYQGTSGQGGYVPFDICITSPPACDPGAANLSDDCTSATPINSFNGFCGTTSASYTVDEFTQFCPGSGTGGTDATVENNSWLTFVADNTTVEIKYWISSGDASCIQGVQFALFEGTCGALSLLPSSCINPSGAPGSFGLLSFTGLTVGNQYYIMTDGFSGQVCDFVWQGINGINIFLNVDWGNLAVVQLYEGARIDWSTLSERNNAYFRVEKRTASDVTWQTVGTVLGSGNTATEHFYTYLDKTFSADPVSYYRIAQVDYDGKTTFSEVVALDRNLGEELVYLFPNPAQHTCTIQHAHKAFAYEVVHMQGRTVRAGSSTTGTAYIDIGDLERGMYFVRISSLQHPGSDAVVRKLMIE